ncbi:MAG: hypothetical protein ACREJ3_10520, partial [Polyangiaceae bacterium]
MRVLPPLIATPCLVSLSIASWAPAVIAQMAPGIDVRTWQPSIDPNASMVLEPTTTPGAWQWNTGAWVHYDQDPVALTGLTGSGALPSSRRLIAHSIGTDIVGAVGLGDRTSVGLDIPMLLWQDGASSVPESLVHGGHAPATRLGDVTVLGKVAIVSDDRDGVE